MVLNAAPAVDLAKHRPEVRVGTVQPVTQRLQRTGGQTRPAADNQGLPAIARVVRAVDGQFDGRGGEAQMLDIEADQCRSSFMISTAR
jgi:hypothetical protein